MGFWHKSATIASCFAVLAFAQSDCEHSGWNDPRVIPEALQKASS